MATIGSSGEQTKSSAGGLSTEGRTREGAMCEVCQKVDGLKRCARCGVVAYCGKEHQLADWKTHKQVCKKPRE